MIEPKFLKPYEPEKVEDKIYEYWQEKGYFSPDKCKSDGLVNLDLEPFSIVLPPPNVTGTLHVGHSAMLVIQDIMVRFARMQGRDTLWLPGTDHASIATQSKVEKILEKEEGKRRQDLGREEFLKRVNKFAQDSHDTIINQVKKMGASVDFEREAFTLDEKRSLAVRTAFKKMYDDGLIYRGHRIVNWDPKGQTVISDDEIVYVETKAKLYTFKYSHDFPISISTTRPETKLGDTAVAVNPKDPRYQQYIGQEFTVPDFCGESLTIQIVADDMVEIEFGTGALGVTPAHSQIDAEIAERHKLKSKTVINEFAKMIVGNENILGKKTTEARQAVVNWLTENNLIEDEVEINQNLSTAERSGATIEPLPKLQWFVNVTKPIPGHDNKTLKDLMLEVVTKKEIEIIPDRFEKVYFNWINNLRDWCISRQIWYGHRIPVWYRSTSLTTSQEDLPAGEAEIYCDINPPEDIENWTQDEDTLDTWFSSGLWTFSTLGWPEETEDFKRYHPTTILETGYDILPFWVARMILFSKYLLKDIPFKSVYFHGLVRDEKGRKMSKSLGNIIDPLDMIQKYGADALRMSLIVGTGPGNDTKLVEDKIKAYKHFANKIWNITRFVLTYTEDIVYDKDFTDFTAEDKALLDEQKTIFKDITKEIESYKYYLAGEKIYHYTWSRFADIILEDSKEIFKTGSEQAKISRAHFLRNSLKDLLIVLHPFMPFITEEIWQTLQISDKPLMVSKWVDLN